jgi:hypothetical protein
MSPASFLQRGLDSFVPTMATKFGVTTSTVSSGTVPPLDSHSPQKKDTRKNAQQAPQDVQGEADIVTDSKGFR